MATYQYDYRKIATVFAVIVVVLFVYKNYVKESFTQGADLKKAYTPPPASHMTGGTPTFTDGNAVPSAGDKEHLLPFSVVDSSVMYSPLDAAASAPASAPVSAATSTVAAISPGSAESVEPMAVGDGDMYSRWT